MFSFYGDVGLEKCRSKAILFSLVRAFEFELAVPVSEIEAKATVVSRPVLRSDPKSKPQMPMWVKVYKQT